MPLLDRNDALATLDALWQRAVAGRGQVVLVAGEAGIGKTALVQGFFDRVREPDHLRLSVAVPPTPVPYAAWGRLAESDADLRARLEASGGYDQIVFGVIDVMLCAPTMPVNAFKLSILAVEGAEPGASGEVLRLAARDAARSVLSRAGQGD